jgi:hypothetical protein
MYIREAWNTFETCSLAALEPPTLDGADDRVRETELHKRVLALALTVQADSLASELVYTVRVRILSLKLYCTTGYKTPRSFCAYKLRDVVIVLVLRLALPLFCASERIDAPHKSLPPCSGPEHMRSSDVLLFFEKKRPVRSYAATYSPLRMTALTRTAASTTPVSFRIALMLDPIVSWPKR